MAELIVEQYVVGPVMTNCYFAVNKDSGEALLIDPGDSAKSLIAKIKEENLILDGILLTHGHFDHARGAEEIAKEFNVLIYAEEHEKETLETPSINLGGMIGVNEVYHADKFVKDNDILRLAGFTIQVMHTPGHTKGGCCYYFKDEKAVFAGDTLFYGSVGRTDFPGGSASVLIKSIKDKLMVLPDEVKVYTGHNENTTIGWERKNNPFL